MLHFDVRDRATVSGVDYRRKGGLCQSHNRYATDTIEFGKVATETARRTPLDADVERRVEGGFSRFAHRAPYASAALIVLVGLYTGWSGLHEFMI